jgi:flavin-dependent dehydrogenase
VTFGAYGTDPDGAWRGFQAWRSRFDALLTDRVRELGGEILTDWRAQEPLVEDGTVVGVATARGELRASVVVDAAGGGHWLARRLGLEIERHSPQLIAAYGYGEGAAPVARDAPLFSTRDSSWSWIARVRAATYQWTTLELDPDHGALPGPPPELSRLRHGPVRSADVTWRRVSRPAGPGYVMAGDAAAVVDPAASHGVLRALLGGLLAGDVAVAAAGGGAEPLAAGYTAWLDEGFRHDTDALLEQYAALPAAPDWVRARPRGAPRSGPGSRSRRRTPAAPAGR